MTSTRISKQKQWRRPSWGGNVGTSQNFDYTDENSADHGAGESTTYHKNSRNKGLDSGMARWWR